MHCANPMQHDQYVLPTKWNPSLHSFWSRAHSIIQTTIRLQLQNNIVMIHPVIKSKHSRSMHPSPYGNTTIRLAFQNVRIYNHPRQIPTFPSGKHARRPHNSHPSFQMDTTHCTTNMHHHQQIRFNNTNNQFVTKYHFP